MSYRADTLDCQQCGTILKQLSPLEAQKIADNPFNFICYCSSCKNDILADETKYLTMEEEK